MYLYSLYILSDYHILFKTLYSLLSRAHWTPDLKRSEANDEGVTFSSGISVLEHTQTNQTKPNKQTKQNEKNET